VFCQCNTLAAVSSKLCTAHGIDNLSLCMSQLSTLFRTLACIMDSPPPNCAVTASHLTLQVTPLKSRLWTLQYKRGLPCQINACNSINLQRSGKAKRSTHCKPLPFSSAPSQWRSGTQDGKTRPEPPPDNNHRHSCKNVLRSSIWQCNLLEVVRAFIFCMRQHTSHMLHRGCTCTCCTCCTEAHTCCTCCACTCCTCTCYTCYTCCTEAARALIGTRQHTTFKLIT
jgi:hypothetical protein